jgi:hypothetical protein
MRSIVPQGCDHLVAGTGQAARMHPAPRAAVVATAALLVGLSGACRRSGDGDGPATVTGRVVSLTAEVYCVSDDRGVTKTCVDIPDQQAVAGVDVGECVTTTLDLRVSGGRVEVVADAACAAGDLGG